MGENDGDSEREGDEGGVVGEKGGDGEREGDEGGLVTGLCSPAMGGGCAGGDGGGRGGDGERGREASVRSAGGTRVKGLAKGMRRAAAMEARLGGGRPGLLSAGWYLNVTGKPMREEAVAITRARTRGWSCGAWVARRIESLMVGPVAMS